MGIISIAFIITSVINTISTNLTYGKRSYYSMNERFQQTLHTIHSIKQNVPESTIYLVEGSKITNDMEFIIESLVDYYINVKDITYIKNGIESKLKGYGEAVQIEYLISNYNFKEYDYVFKISGRYYLNNNFNLEYLLNFNSILFCKGKSKNPPIVSTVLYMIPNSYIDEITDLYIKIGKLYENYNIHLLRGGKNILHYERIIPQMLHNYVIIESIGVEGLVSSYKTLYKC
jgi:hypothetical protein